MQGLLTHTVAVLGLAPARSTGQVRPPDGAENLRQSRRRSTTDADWDSGGIWSLTRAPRGKGSPSRPSMPIFRPGTRDLCLFGTSHPRPESRSVTLGGLDAENRRTQAIGMQAQRFIEHVKDGQIVLELPESFANKRVEVIVLALDEDRPRVRKPPASLAGKMKSLAKSSTVRRSPTGR